MLYKNFILAAALSLICFQSVGAQGQDTKSTKEFSGIYPHLAMSNNEGECGTGAVVPWAGYLWVTTYGPHCVKESSDKLYRISEALEQTVMSESVGGTHADRLIHKPTNNLIIGCYIVDSKGKIRVIPRDEMPGRITGAAHAITSPESRVAFATMEEGLYEVDINNLEVKEIIRDGNSAAAPKGSNSGAKNSKLHGYHGKGFYKGFGKYFYANNGVLPHPALRSPRRIYGRKRGLDSRKNMPIYRDKRPRRHRGKPRARRPYMGAWIRCEILVAWAERGIGLDLFSPAEVEPFLRRVARLEYRMAPHKRNRRTRFSYDNARSVLEISSAI